MLSKLQNHSRWAAFLIIRLVDAKQGNNIWVAELPVRYDLTDD